jgi:ABC-type transporter Mla subunit MlaD
MKKKMLSLTLTMVFLAGIAGIGMAASDVECEVKGIDGKAVTLECDDAGKLKVGDTVKVKAEKKKRMIEGC